MHKILPNHLPSKVVQICTVLTVDESIHFYRSLQCVRVLFIFFLCAFLDSSEVEHLFMFIGHLPFFSKFFAYIFCPFFCLDVLLGRTLSIKHGHPLIGRKTLNFEAPTGRVRALGTGTEFLQH